MSAVLCYLCDKTVVGTSVPLTVTVGKSKVQIVAYVCKDCAKKETEKK